MDSARKTAQLNDIAQRKHAPQFDTKNIQAGRPLLTLAQYRIYHRQKRAQNMQDSFKWMTTLQRRKAAFSYAETDCADSDSDFDDCQRRLETKRKLFVKGTKCERARTAPISIPSSSCRHLHPYESVAGSPDLSYHADMRLLHAQRYLYVDEDSRGELDEDDPAFYGNLAFFHSQYGVSHTGMAKRSVYPLKTPAVPASPTGVDDREEDIFAMEL